MASAERSSRDAFLSQLYSKEQLSQLPPLNNVIRGLGRHRNLRCYAKEKRKFNSIKISGPWPRLSSGVDSISSFDVFA